MIPHRGFVMLLGLSLGLACMGGSSSRFHQGRANEGCRKDAAADAVRYAVDRPAELSLPADTSLPVDSASDGQSPDSDAGLIIDALLADDGQGDAGESADACDDAPKDEVGRACGRSPWILLGQVPNVRQLGGLPLVTGGSVACDLVYRGSALSTLNEQGCVEFAAAGIKTVVDLRSEGEQTAPPVACVTEHAKLVSASLPTPYNVSPTDYLADLYTAPSMRKLFAVLADRASYPVYYHCLYGKDRTGVVTAVILSALGVPRQTIQDEYLLSREAGMSVYPESLAAVLDELERIGLDAYFQTIGVPPEQVQAMRQILTAPR